MGAATQQAGTIDIIGTSDVTGPAGAIRISRTGTGLQISVDGAAPEDIGSGGSGYTITVPTLGPGVDMAPAINTAIVLAGALGPGGVVELGPGTFDISTQIILDEVNGVTLRGQGKVATTLEIQAAATAVTDGYIQVNDCYGATLERFSVTASVSLTSARPDAIRLQGAGSLREVNTGSPTALSGYTVRDVEIIGCYNGVHVKDTTVGPFSVWIEDSCVQPCNGGSGVWIDSILGGMHYVSNMQINSLTPAASTPGLAAVRVSSTGDVTLTNINTYQCDYGLLVNPGNGQTINYLGVGNCVFDTNDLGNCKLACTGTGKVLNANFENTWFAGCMTDDDGGNNVYVGAACTSIYFNNCRAYFADVAIGVCFLADTGSSRVHFLDCAAKGPAHIGFGLGGSADAGVMGRCDVGAGPNGEVIDLGIYINGATTKTMSGQHSINATTPTSGSPTVSLGANMNYP